MKIKKNELKISPDHTQKILTLLNIKDISFIQFSIKENWMVLMTQDNSETIQPMTKMSLDFFKQSITNRTVKQIENMFDSIQNMGPNELYHDSFQIRKDVELLWIEMSTVKLEEDLYYSFIQNKTDHKLLYDKVISYDQQESIILDNISEFVARYDIDGRLIYYNDAFQKQFKLGYLANYNIRDDDSDKEWFESLFREPHFNNRISYYEEFDFYINWYNQVVFMDGKIDSIVSVGMNVTEFKKSHDQLQYELIHDIETDFFNERGLSEKLETMQGQTFDLYYIYVASVHDAYKIYGEEVSGKLLQEINNSLKKYEEKGFIVAKIDYTNYVLINDFSVSSKKTLERRLLQTLNRPILVDNFTIYVASDIGMISYPYDTKNINLLIPYGDLTAEHAGQLKTTSIQRFKKSLYEQSLHDVELLTALVNAIKQREITVVFQEIIHLPSREVCFIETLARWKHQRFGQVAPRELFKLANQTYIAYELDFLIIDKAFNYFRTLKKTNKYKNTILTINITPKTFINEGLYSDLEAKTLAYDLDPKSICIEISEDTFVNEEVDYVEIVKKLRALGFLIAIDDFGKKYSSLAIINDTASDIIKVDKSFVENLDSASSKTILEMVIQLSKDLNRLVIVEGVEEKQQLEKLNKMGFHYYQGYYFCQPTCFSRLIDGEPIASLKV